MRDAIRVPKAYTERSVRNAYEQFKKRRVRLQALERAYYTGQVGEAPQEYVVNNCKVVADTKAAYIAGIPTTYSAAEGDDKGEAIIDLFRRQVKPQLDQEITNLCSRFGLAFEVAYIERSPDGGTVPKSVALSPLEGFVAYDETLDPDSVFGAIHYVETDDNGQEHHFLEVYDSHEVVRYAQSSSQGGSWGELPGSRRPHGFDRVPITEFRNNPDMIGDFEPILPLQKAINEVLSDRVRDKNRFASAMLVTQGVAFGDSDDEVRDLMGKLKEDEYLALPRDATVQYLTKTFDESSVQILVDHIDAQMHKVSGIPDMTDESFASNASGVAIKYKLMALNNLAQSFVSQFDRGFLRRCKLYSYALFGADGADVDMMAATFKFNLPADYAYDAQTMQVYIANGALSRRTMMDNCPFVDDAEREQERIDAEASADDERSRSNFEDLLQRDLEDAADEEEDDVA